MRLVCTVIRSHNITLKIYITPLSEDFGDLDLENWYSFNSDPEYDGK